MLRRLLCGMALVVLVGCGGSDDPGVPSATIAPADTPEKTTTSTTEAMTPEEEVEAAYLRSWDVYAESMLKLDGSRLDEAFAEEALDLRRREVAGLKEDGTPARMAVDHNIGAVRIEGNEAKVLDNYVNHSVLLDAETREPIEQDPNSPSSRTYTLERIGNRWLVTFVLDNSPAPSS